jgi:hypothetical protein
VAKAKQEKKRFELAAKFKIQKFYKIENRINILKEHLNYSGKWKPLNVIPL